MNLWIFAASWQKADCEHYTLLSQYWKICSSIVGKLYLEKYFSWRDNYFEFWSQANMYLNLQQSRMQNLHKIYFWNKRHKDIFRLARRGHSLPFFLLYLPFSTTHLSFQAIYLNSMITYSLLSDKNVYYRIWINNI